MKFTEGYWEKSERANANYAAQAYIVEEIRNGLRVISPVKEITTRAGALDVMTITTEFTSIQPDVISVRSYHYDGYEKNEPRFELNSSKPDVEIQNNEMEAILKSGRVQVRIDKKEFRFIFEAEGKVLTTCGFRNLGYMQYDRSVSTKFPESNYMSAEYTPYMVTELSLSPGECVYGLGERFTAFVKNGQVVDIWNEDGGTASQISYKNIPFYMTNKKYGVYVDHSDRVSFEVGSEKVESVGFSVPGEEIRYQLIYGADMKEIIRRYTDLTGKPALLPQWSFGLWLSTSFTTNYDEETTSSFIDGMKEREIPLSVFHFDCFWMKEFHWCDFEWDERIFPDVQNMIRRYKEEKGLKLCVWINPYIAQGTAFYQEGKENGYYLRRADGRGIKQIDNWQPGMALVDFTNPDAVQWYLAKLKKLLDIGVDCFKTDFGERIPVDVQYFDGSDSRSMHNYYTYLYNKAVFGLLKKEKKEDAILFARSATVGGQKFPVHWGGDCSASYQSMAESLRGGLSLTMSGFSFWSHDIGGFELTASPDLYKRWMQFGLLSTHSRLHGSKSYRVPWLFDEEAVSVCREFTKLKARLMPYIYSAAVQSHLTGVPSMRAMIMEFGQDPAVPYLDMQYMLGERLLVAPVFSESGTVQYYLPQGKWTHLLSSEVREGGRWYEDTYDYFSLPLYVRENTLLPLGIVEERPDYDYTKNTVIRVYELQDKSTAECVIYNGKVEEAATIEAVRKGNTITIKAEALGLGMKILMVNLNEVSSVTGGNFSVTEDGILITPEQSELVIVR